jgi:predicted nucleic acid-binding protein
LPFSKFEENILADLRKTGQTIGIEDMMIAASALTNQCTVVDWVEHLDIFCWVSFLYPTYKMQSGPG